MEFNPKTQNYLLNISRNVYLQSHNLLHLNLSSNNILLDESLNPKISGFSLTNDFKIIYSAFNNGERPILTDSISQKCEDLIQKCWSEDPDERPSFDEILHILIENPKSIMNSEIDVDEFFGYIKTLKQ